MRDGIICIDKPAEHTSFDVIARVRGILHMKKVGHAGTLDPLAAGVLPVYAGQATRLIEYGDSDVKSTTLSSSWDWLPIPKTVRGPSSKRHRFRTLLPTTCAAP